MSHSDAKKAKLSEEDDVVDLEEIDTGSTTESMTEAEKVLALSFQPTNLILNVGGVEFRVIKEHLMVESPVFAAMFNSSFKEAKSDVLELPGKNPGHFVRFLRQILPSYNDILTETTAHDLLPLAEEYQTEQLKKKIDDHLATVVDNNSCTSEEIINALIEAEMYKLKNYLEKCIDVASRKIHKLLTNNPKYSKVTFETRLQICLLRCSKIEEVYESTSTTSYYNDSLKAKLKPFMNDC